MHEEQVDAMLVIEQLRSELGEAHYELAIARARLKDARNRLGEHQQNRESHVDDGARIGGG